MKFLNSKLIITVIAVSLSIILFSQFTVPGANILDSSTNQEPKIDVAPLELNDKIINFTHTDENKDETFIIKTDSEIYEGEDSADIYISITNTTKNFEKAVVLFYFPKTSQGEIGARLETLEQRSGNDWKFLTLFKSNIKINEELLKNALKKRELIPGEQEIKGGSQIEIPAGQTAYLKLKISFPVESAGEFWIEAIGSGGGYGLLDPMFVSRGGTRIGKTTTSSDTTPGWYQASGNNWDYRRKITIDESKVSGISNLSNFPVLVSLTYPDLKTIGFGGKAASGSGEFVFTSSDGTTVLPYEIETYSSSSGQFIGWVNVTTLSVTQDTIIYVYYGGPSSGATNQNKTGVWDSNYKGVWHLKEDPAVAGTNGIKDSTSNGNHGTDNGSMDANDQVAGQMNGSLDFDGSDDYVRVEDSSSLNFQNSSVSIGMWIYWGGTVSGRTIAKANSGGSPYHGDFFMKLDTSNQKLSVRFKTNDSSQTQNPEVVSSINFPINKWAHAFATFNTDTDTTRLYTNGILVAEDTVSIYELLDTTGFLCTCNPSFPPQSIGGKIDEIRVSNTVRSADWIKTEYTNQFKPSLFYAVGGLESRISSTTRIGRTTTSSDTTPGWYQASGNNWDYRKKITVDKNKVSGASNLSNFPLLISRTDPDFKHTSFGGNVASSSAGITGGGGDFVFTSSDGTTKLDHEIEKYASSSGELWAWVEVPTLSVAQDTIIYVYYGGPSSGATNQNKTGVWDSNYQGVWHLSERVTDETGTGIHYDSRSSPVNGNQVNNDDIDGKIARAQIFDGTGDYIDMNNNVDLERTSPMTFSLWVKSYSDTPSAAGSVFGKWNSSNVGYDLNLRGDIAGDPYEFELRGSGGWPDSLFNEIFNHNYPALSSFHYVVVTYDGSSTHAGTLTYINGGIVNRISDGGLITNITNTGSFNIGSVKDGTFPFNGAVDEFRISNTVRSADWIKTEYTNQSKSSTFYIFGGRQKRNP
ncbi:MAG: hypothetical protein A3J47_02860 [Candidatus Yanofskybacteria bacterium RIFCSPHIGHO2_02_FULL_43_22]|uniref:DUF2341 domain-containing protein n=1 Tax=Candidatus Yanofskybacteria bacterium RIFCSPHIGHO2_02_FULL_43_22 TaxID=1802681 RepID=A0A1F8FS13_9BACT|nr:MAG: hypothetical protein A3J47_02860 [Candidatus Yanofskybacteria bacterium RIFCSPHIGHO2_02_FULL_43_22]